jgi:hypothetical protein
MTPLTTLGVPALPVTGDNLRDWQTWTAAVLGALAALDGPLADALPEDLLTHFDPLVVGAAALLIVLRDEADGQAVAWDDTRIEGRRVRVLLANGRGLLVRGLDRVAPADAVLESWLTAVVGLAQVTLQAVNRWPDLAPTLPATLRYN